MNPDDSDFVERKSPNFMKGKRETEILGEITIIGIGPSSDPSVLFEEFTKRFSVMPIDEEKYDGISRPLARIAETGKGNFYELALVLASLFVLNRMDVDLVQVWSNREARREHHELGKLEHLLVYVPALDRYFDPTSRTSAQLTEAGIAPWLEECPRIYNCYPAGLIHCPSDHFGRGYYGKQYTQYARYTPDRFRPRRRYNSDFFRRRSPDLMRIHREREILREISTIGIGPSSDAAVLFEEFGERFSVVSIEEEYDYIPRPLARIAETGKANFDELALVLASLFVWNRMDVECVEVWSNREARRGHSDLGNLEHLLVYVPAIDRYFDPTSRMSAQLTETGIAPWLEEQPRIYSRYPSDNIGRGFYGKRYTHYPRYLPNK
jgi:hypothetical protein